jgi:hypothetical protein
MSFQAQAQYSANTNQLNAFVLPFMLFGLTLIGIGCGPWIAGVLSDYFTAQGEAHPLARALELILIFNALSILCLLMSSRNYRADAERAARLD